MEMGVTLDFLVSEKKQSGITVYDCDFRKRLRARPSLIQKLFNNSQEKWHEYGEDEKEAINTIHDMLKLVDEQMMKYYSQFTIFPHSITDITLDEIISGSGKLYDLGSPPKLRLALLIARTHYYIGNLEQAYQIASWGLENIGNATGLINDFRQLIQEE